MIVDSHAHAWPRWPYQPPVPDEATRGSVEQLLFDMDNAGVDHALIVAARIDHNPGNNDYVAAAVREHPGRFSHIADIDCRWSPDYHRPGAAGRLTALAEKYSLLGVTHYLDAVNDGWLVSAEGRKFFATAELLGLQVHLAITPPWQADLQRVAAEFPGLQLVMHHLAAVHIWDGSVREGLELVLPAARWDNIWVKISGFYYRSDMPWDYPYQSMLNVVRAFYEEFGPSRLVWASDFPASRVGGPTYRQALEVVRSHCPFISATDLEQILGGNLAAAIGGNQ